MYYELIFVLWIFIMILFIIFLKVIEDGVKDGDIVVLEGFIYFIFFVVGYEIIC